MKQLFESQGQFALYTSKSKVSKKFNKITEILEKDLSYLEIVGKDFYFGKKQKRGAKGITVEQVVRIALVKQIEQLSYDALYDQLHDNITYRNFCKLYNVEDIPERATLWENISKISAEGWQAINRVLLVYASNEKIELGKKIRVDSTGTESNIHYPTDGSLLWDGVRVLTRIMECVREEYPDIKFLYMDHTRRAKRRHYKIVNSRKEEKRRAAYKDLLKVSKLTIEYAGECIVILKDLDKGGDIEAKVYCNELEKFVSLLWQVIDQATCRVINGEKVSSRDKIVSLFEPHADILVKGKRDIIFGHKILLTGGESSLILDCMIEKGNWSDSEKFKSCLDRVKDIYSESPRELAADGGFASRDNSLYAESLGISKVLFTKIGKTKAVQLAQTSRAYKRLKKFRAGIEGCISTAKRCYGLNRCNWSGWEGFRKYIWSCVVAFNCMTLAAILLQ